MTIFRGLEAGTKMEMETMSTRRKGRGRPRSGLNEMIAIRWEPWLLKGIDTYGGKMLLNRPAALKHIVTKFLTDQKLVDPAAMYPGERESAAR
jgi:hypothetical protein